MVHFTNGDFSTFNHGGQPYNSNDVTKIDAYKQVLRKFKDLVSKILKNLPLISADMVSERVNTTPGKHVQQTEFIKYKWCKFYIDGYQGSFGRDGKRKLQNVFGLSIDKDGLKLSIDNYALGGKSSNAICCQTLNGTSDFPELVNEICYYITRHFDEYIENGAKNGIKECKILLNLINMKRKVLGSYNLILTGAPGTGKTYLAHEIAATILGVTSWKDVEKDTSLKAKCEMVQFHPSYDYSDFVEGLRPVKDANGGIGFERKDGVFKAFCKKALEDGFEKNKGDYVIIDDSGKKNLKPKANQQKYVFIIDEINRGEMSKIFGELFFSIDPGYRGIDGAIKTQYANLNDGPNEFDKALGYTHLSDKENFGHFFVPENVYIIGTMNDIDRSVESMDFAMRRRFAFQEIKAVDRIAMWDGNIDNYKQESQNRMKSLNKAIEVIPGLNSAYHVGPSYFLKLKDNGGKFDDLWSTNLEGLLFEYLRGMLDAEELLDKLHRVYKEANQKELTEEEVKKIMGR